MQSLSPNQQELLQAHLLVHPEDRPHAFRQDLVWMAVVVMVFIMLLGGIVFGFGGKPPVYISRQSLRTRRVKTKHDQKTAWMRHVI